MILYHGTEYLFEKFNLESIGSGTDEALQEGWGIYLTSERNDAYKYATKNKSLNSDGNFIYQVEFTPKAKILKTSSRVNLRYILKTLIEFTPNYAECLEDYAERDNEPETSIINRIIRDYLDMQLNPIEAIQILTADFYHDSEIAEFIHAMSSLGISGFELKRNLGIKHYVLFNPKELNILKVENLNEYLPD